jgi:glycosyltransferase involved in cell wall biosynthesis
MRLLTFSTLYPNDAQPAHGVFVENRLRHLLTDHPVETTVVAPIAYFPFASSRFGDYAKLTGVPSLDVRHGLSVHHPRYLTLPKIGMSLAPLLMYLSLRRRVKKLIEKHGPFDLIDAHYFYPDGVAAALLAREFNLPLSITARGTDINLIPDYKIPRRQILWAAAQAAKTITVCEALRTEMIRLGIKPDKITTLRNGVDLDIFHDRGRSEARDKLRCQSPTLLSVGHLIERKGHHLVIDALTQLPDMQLLIAGEGPERTALENQVQNLGLTSRVRFLGQVAHDQLRELYVAADILVLASSREGWPNVLLEAMACGTPVVATDVWGSGEVIGAYEAGRLVPERTSNALATSIQELLCDLPDRKSTRIYAEGFSWTDTSNGQFELFKTILDADENSSS